MKITQDCHIHTCLSSCARQSATVEHYISKALELGLTSVGFADHVWDEAIPGANGFYQSQGAARILELKKQLSGRNSGELRILCGCETEYSPGGGVALTKESAQQMDFVLVPNSHTHMTMPKEFVGDYPKHAAFMLKVYHEILQSELTPWITAIAHPFHAVGCPYDPQLLHAYLTDRQFMDCFRETARLGIAVEINVDCFRRLTLSSIYQHPYLHMLQIAKECGCKFTIGSDAHGADFRDGFEKIYVVTSLLELRQEDIKTVCPRTGRY